MSQPVVTSVPLAGKVALVVASTMLRATAASRAMSLGSLLSSSGSVPATAKVSALLVAVACRSRAPAFTTRFSPIVAVVSSVP